MKKQLFHSHDQIRTGSSLWLIGLFLLLSGTVLNAQSISWISDYPRIDGTIVVLEDERALQMRFTPIGGVDIANATVEVQLPRNMEYASVSTTTAGLTFTSAVTGTIASGQKVTITVTSNLNKLIQGTSVYFEVKFKAKCEAHGSATFDVQIKSGGTLVTDGQNDVTVNVLVPSLSLTSTDGTIHYPTQTTVNTITYTLKTTTTDKASSAQVTFTTDLASTLSDFRLNGAPISTLNVTQTGTSNIYTINFTPAALGNSKIDNTNGKVITFKGGSTMCGSRIITARVQYPNDSNCASVDGSLVTMAFEGSALPSLETQSVTYVDYFYNDTVIPPTGINMNGATATYVKAVFKNTDIADAYEVALHATPYGQFAYIDTSKVYVQVEGGAKQKVTAAEITINNQLGSSTQYCFLKPGPVYAYGIDVKVPGSVPKGKTITYWIATINGNIYNNLGNNVFHDYPVNTINGFVAYISSLKNQCGDPGTVTPSSRSIESLNASHYRQLPASMSIKGNQIRKQTLFVAPGSTNEAPAEFFIETPTWLTIQSIKLTENIDGSGFEFPQASSTHVGNTYSVTYKNQGFLTGAYLQIEYKADPCGGTTNTPGKINYWVNQNWPGGPTQTLEKISQVFQDVTLECAVDGIVLDEFKLVRTTKGYKDSDNNGVPDDGTIAPDNEIRHDVYVEGDEGYFYWKGTVKSSGYKYIDIPVQATGFTLGTSDQVILTGQNTVTINGAQVNTPLFTYTYLHWTYGYFRFQYDAGLPNGATVEIKAPFRVNGATNNYNNIATEFYVSATPVDSPNNNSASDALLRHGKDKSSAQIGLYNMDSYNWWNNDALTETFWGTGNKTISIGYVDIFHADRLSSPWFSKEVRFLEYLEKLVWNLPKGYQLDSPIYFSSWKTSPATGTITVPADGSSTELQKIHNISNVYDLAFNGSTPLAAGKKQLPDDAWTLNFTGTMRATREARVGSSTMTRVATWRRPGGGTYENTLTVTLNYIGEGTTLDIAPDTVTAYGPTVTNPVLNMVNPNPFTMQSVYFYIAGNVKNVHLKEASTNAVYDGQGIGNRWVKVANIPQGASRSYTMTYDYDGNSTNTGDTVTVYTASGYTATWDPNMNLPLNSQSDVAAHIGNSGDFILKTAPATISGSITSKDTIPDADTGYQVKVSFSTTSSDGALKNPEMVLTVPAGQYYESAELEYPVGSTPLTAVPNAMHTYLNNALGIGSDLSVARTVTVKLADAGMAIIPGHLEPAAALDHTRLTASVVLTMKAACTTDFSGIQYKGAISGTSTGNEPADRNGTEVVSQAIYPDVVLNYLFDEIKIATTSGIRAFNEVQTQDTLLLKITKVRGRNTNMLITDSLRIEMPKELNLDGNLIYYDGGSGAMSALTGTTGTLGSNVVAASGVRTLRFPMPIDAYNTAVNKGQSAEVIYKIPIKYTPNGQTRASTPIDSIVPAVYIEAKFGTCAVVRTPIGSGVEKFALLTADSIPYVVYGGNSAPLKITSSGFTGDWYVNQTTLTPLSSANPLVLTPAASTSYYFSAIFNGSSDNYGRLPYPVIVYTVRPQFVRNLGTDRYICRNEKLSVHVEGMDIKYQWYYNLTTPITGATDSSYMPAKSGKYHVLATDLAGERISSDTINVSVNEIPVFTKDLPIKARECYKWGVTLKVEATGHDLFYQWYRNGIEIPGANSDSYEALAQDSSAFFRVSVKTLCGDSIMSEQCYMSFCDEDPLYMNINREVELVAPNTVETHPITGKQFIPSHTDFEFTVKVKDGYILKYIHVTTDDPIWTIQGGIVRKVISDEEMKVIIRTVTKALQVTVSGIVPVSNLPVESDPSKTWAYNGKIYVNTTEAETVYIFTPMGFLYKREKVEKGITAFDAQPGIYFIKFGSGYSGKVFVR